MYSSYCSKGCLKWTRRKNKNSTAYGVWDHDTLNTSEITMIF